MSATADSEFALWKATKNIKHQQQPIPPIKKQDGSWARSEKEKAETFASHLKSVFQPLPSQLTLHEEQEIKNALLAPYQMTPLPNLFTVNEIRQMIKNSLNPKKSPGYDLITGQLFKELPRKGIVMLTIIYNAVIRLGYFPAQWKISEIVLIPKPDKPLNEVTSYRPISLLPIMGKLFEKLLATRLEPIIEDMSLIPEHQFGFRRGHSTIHQVHRIVDIINSAFEEKEYCTAAFLDESQAFDRVWHEGLLYKLRKTIPHCYFIIIKSFLDDRYFQVKYGQERSELYPIKSGVPQGSILSPTLYLLFTADFPTNIHSFTATFADDKAVLVKHKDPTVAATLLQLNLYEVEQWAKKWRVKINSEKSAHITFTKRKGTTPPVLLNNSPLRQVDDIKYLGMHLDKGLTWKTHVWKKRKQLGLKMRKHYWLIGRRSKLSLSNKMLVYKAVIKPIWTYGLQLWGAAANSTIQCIERFQNKTLRVICDAPYFVRNVDIIKDLKVNTVREEISKCSEKYLEKLSSHTNTYAVNLLDNSAQVQRLKRFKPLDLPHRFN